VADRTWNAVDARLWDEYRLSKCARAVLAHIISICPNPYGIYDPSPLGRVLDWWTELFTREQVLNAFAELEQQGIGVSFRDGQCWWLVKKFKREGANFRSQKARDGIKATLSKYPEIEEQFYSVHGYLVSESAIPNTSGIAKKDTKPQLVRQKRHTSDPDPESETELPPLPPQGEPEPAAPARGTSRKRKAEDPGLISQAEELHAIILAGIEKLNIPHGRLKLDAQKTAIVLRLLRDSDKFNIADLPGILEWACGPGGWNDPKSGEWIPYIRVLLSPDNWRNLNRAGTDTKINTAREKWLRRGPPGSETGGPSEALQELLPGPSLDDIQERRERTRKEGAA